MKPRDSHSIPSTNVFEVLESRRLLAATLLDDGTLEIIGTVKADTIFVTRGPDALDRIVVQINREITSFRYSDVQRIWINGGPNNDHIEFRAYARTADRFDIPTTIYGSGGDDLIIGPGSSARIYGGMGNDKIFGGPGRDIIYGEWGDDTLFGEQGNDYIRGGEGNDEIHGGLGNNQLFGDEGNDTFFTRGNIPFRLDTRPFLTPSNFDRIDGGPGFDRADADDVDRLISIEQRFIKRP